jgi:hypothetical protein
MQITKCIFQDDLLEAGKGRFHHVEPINDDGHVLIGAFNGLEDLLVVASSLGALD